LLYPAEYLQSYRRAKFLLILLLVLLCQVTPSKLGIMREPGVTHNNMVEPGVVTHNIEAPSSSSQFSFLERMSV
jgi:hypothetical protein